MAKPEQLIQKTDLSQCLSFGKDIGGDGLDFETVAFWGGGNINMCRGPPDTRRGDRLWLRVRTTTPTPACPTSARRAWWHGRTCRTVAATQPPICWICSEWARGQGMNVGPTWGHHQHRKVAGNVSGQKAEKAEAFGVEKSLYFLASIEIPDKTVCDHEVQI